MRRFLALAALIVIAGIAFSQSTIGRSDDSLRPGVNYSHWLQSNVSGGGQGVNGVASAQQLGVNTNYWYIAKNTNGGCPTTITNCTAIYGDTQYINDATSNSTTTITCPNSDCNFVAGDVGKTVWMNTNGQASTFGIALTSTVLCPVTTITAVNSAQSITVGTTCTASATATGVLVWGHRDGSTLHALDGNSTPCVDFEPFSRAVIMVDQAEFITSGSCTQALAFTAKSWGRAGGGSSAFVMTPDFNFTTCTGAGGTHAGNNVCFGSGLVQVNDLFVWGNGLTLAGNSNCNNALNKVILEPNFNGSSMVGVNIAGICYGQTGEGVEVSSLDEYWVGGGAQFVMTQPCLISSASSYTEILDCRNDGLNFSYGLTVISGGSNVDAGSYPIAGAVVLSGGNLSTRGTHFWTATGNNTCALQIQGSWFSYGDFVGTDPPAGAATGLCFSSGGIVQSSNTTFKGPSGVTAINWGGGTFTSLGGNTVSGVVTQASVPLGIAGWDVLQGACTGTVTSASTIGLFGLGNNTTTTCTSTTTNIGPTMGKAGNLYGFTCYAGTGGNQAADACTVMKNNSATSLTCSLNGATSCTDGVVAHQTTYAIGDIITVKVVSGTSTTLANVKASVLAW